MDNVNKWLTLTANVGVIFGIVFLGFEIRQNTIAVKSEAALGIQSQVQSIYNMLLTDPMMEIYVRGMEDPTNLDPVRVREVEYVFSGESSGFSESICPSTRRVV